MAYAEKTSVSVERSKGEIEQILTRYGADEFGYAANHEQAMVQFKAQDRHVRFIITQPRRDDPLFTHTEKNKKRTEIQAEKEWEQARRQRWRALALVVKAKLEAVETGITTFEEEFLAHILLPNGQTVAETAIPALAKAYKTGKMQTLLPAPGEK